MDWWVHRIGANRAFKQLMNTGGRGDRRGTHNTIDAISVCCIIVVDGIIVRLWWCKLMVMMKRRRMVVMTDLILFRQPIRGWHTLNTIQFHQTTKQNQIQIFFFQIFNQKLLVDIFLFLSSSPKFLPLFIFFFWRRRREKKKKFLDFPETKHPLKGKKKKKKVLFFVSAFSLIILFFSFLLSLLRDFVKLWERDICKDDRLISKGASDL